jgi:type IV secretion system protein VirB6
MIACVALLIAYAVFLITLAKLFLWLLLALAPVFILLLLFGVTSRFFAGWLSALVQYATVQILVYAFLAFYLSLSQQFFDQVTAVSGAQTATFGNVAPNIVVALIGFFLLMQISMVAATIAGGIAIRAPSLGRSLDGARGLLALPAQGWREARDGAQRRLGRLTLTERQIGERMGRQQLAARGWLQSPEARQIQAQLAGRGSGRP